MEQVPFRRPTKEEMEVLEKDIQEVLKKHHANLSVKAQIEFFVEETPSPFVVANENGDTNIKTEETPEIN